MQEIIWLIMNNVNTEKAKKEHVLVRVPYLESTKVESPIEKLTSMKRPLVVKTHLRADLIMRQVSKKADSGPKVVVVMRNPKDILVSYYYFYKACKSYDFKGSFDDFFRLYESDDLVYGDPLDYCQQWMTYKDNPNVIIIHYEDLKADLKSCIKNLSTFCQRELPNEQIENLANHVSFDSMKKNPQTNFESFIAMRPHISPFIRKGIVGDWKNHLTPEQSELIDKRCEILHKLYGLSFRFL